MLSLVTGTNGFLTIYLARPIIPTQITLQHVDPRLGVGPDRRSLTAPRKVSFWAVQDLPAFRSSFKEGGEMQGAVRMADVEFDPRNKPLRTFDLEPEAIKTLEGEKPEPVRVVSFEIESNWGFPKYTCVYRVRVHGKEAPPRRKTSRGNDS